MFSCLSCFYLSYILPICGLFYLVLLASTLFCADEMLNLFTHSLADIVVLVILKQTTRNKDFLLWDSGADDVRRILMFGTLSNLDLLQQHDHWWFIDGTFKVSPTIYSQLFTIHALIEWLLPLLSSMSWCQTNLKTTSQESWKSWRNCSQRWILPASCQTLRRPVKMHV